jgi:hypothetical protein
MSFLMNLVFTIAFAVVKMAVQIALAIAAITGQMLARLIVFVLPFLPKATHALAQGFHALFMAIKRWFWRHEVSEKARSDRSAPSLINPRWSSQNPPSGLRHRAPPKRYF